MARLTLPIWFVTERQLRKALNLPGDDSGATVAFTSMDRVTAFLAAGHPGPWEIQLANDSQELILMVADLHSRCVSTVCVDPQTDGSGAQVSLTEILDADTMAG